MEPIADRSDRTDSGRRRGTGTGRQTIQLAEAFPNREVLAIEPDDGMRIALMTRVADRPELRDRVTVYPWTLSELPGEVRFAAALLHNVVYELPDLGEAFDDLGRRAEPGASVIVNQLHVPSTAAPVERRRPASAPTVRLLRATGSSPATVRR